jgi:hypothetical protein
MTSFLAEGSSEDEYCPKNHMTAIPLRQRPGALPESPAHGGLMLCPQPDFSKATVSGVVLTCRFGELGYRRWEPGSDLLS